VFNVNHHLGVHRTAIGEYYFETGGLSNIYIFKNLTMQQVDMLECSKILSHGDFILSVEDGAWSTFR
jgi:hypothetical protein